MPTDPGAGFTDGIFIETKYIASMALGKSKVVLLPSLQKNGNRIFYKVKYAFLMSKEIRCSRIPNRIRLYIEIQSLKQ